MTLILEPSVILRRRLSLSKNKGFLHVTSFRNFNYVLVSDYRRSQKSFAKRDATRERVRSCRRTANSRRCPARRCLRCLSPCRVRGRRPPRVVPVRAVGTCRYGSFWIDFRCRESSVSRAPAADRCCCTSSNSDR